MLQGKFGSVLFLMFSSRWQNTVFAGKKFCFNFQTRGYGNNTQIASWYCLTCTTKSQIYVIKLLIWCLGIKKWKGAYSKVPLNVCLQTEINMFLEEEGIIEGGQKSGDDSFSAIVPAQVFQKVDKAFWSLDKSLFSA